MAMTAQFLADWTSFYDAVDKGVTKVVSFQDGARKAEDQLNRMVDNFSGRKIIQDATVMAESVERIGGVSKLTASELDRVSRVAQEAAAKMKAMGVDVPPAIQNLANATSQARAEQEKLLDTIGQSGGRMDSLVKGTKAAGDSTGSLKSQYQQFDNVLQAAGINIGTQVKGLFDIADASGKTTSQLGLLTTAGLAAGAAMGGWQIGRWVAGIFDLDQKIAGLTSRIMGWGDVAAETAGAKQDVINRAIANGAAATISYTEAIQFNIDAQQRLSDSYAVSGKNVADIQREVRHLSDAQQEAIKRAIELGATTEQITRHFKVSAGAVKILADEHREAARAAEEHQRKMEALDKAYAKLMSDTKNANQLALMQEEAAFRKQVAEQEAFFAEEEIQVRLRRQAAYTQQLEAEKAAEAARIEANQREIDAVLAAGAAHQASAAQAKQATDTTVAGWQGVQQQVEITGEAVREWGNLMAYTAKVNAILRGGGGLFTSQSQLDRIAALSFEGRAGGGPVSAGQPYLVGEAGPEIVVPTKSGTVIPNGAVGSTHVSVSLQTGPIISTFSEFAALVKGATIEALRDAGLPVPMGVT